MKWSLMSVQYKKGFGWPRRRIWLTGRDVSALVFVESLARKADADVQIDIWFSTEQAKETP